MSVFDKDNVSVLNYNENEVFVDSAKEHYSFSPSRDGITPSVVVMPFSEVQSIASNTDIILTGWLTFDDDVKEEIYTALRVYNWKDILTNEDIKNILTNPTKEGLQRLLDIETLTYFDRVRIMMFKLAHTGTDIPTKVTNLVNRRYVELRNKQRVSSISLTDKEVDKMATSDALEALYKQNESLQKEIEELRKMMSNTKNNITQDSNQNNVQDSVHDSNGGEVFRRKAYVNNNSDYKDNRGTDNNTVKKPGRPKKR